MDAPRISARSLGPALLAVACVAGCGSAAKREARTLLTAIDRYRHAPPASKESEGQAVSAVPCSDAGVCEAKRACVAAIEPTTRALGLKDEVARRLVDLQEKRLAPESDDARALPGKLEEAEKLLREGRANMVACDQRLADLQISLGI